MEKYKGMLYLFISFTLAGTSVITMNFISKSLNMFTITFMSLAILLISLLPFYVGSVWKTMCAAQKQDWYMWILQAVFGIFMFRALLLLGLPFTSTGEAGILTGTTPAITAILAFIFLRDKLYKHTLLGIACTLIGIVLLQGSTLQHTQFSIKHIVGNVLVIVAAASESIFNVISRKQHLTDGAYIQKSIHPIIQTIIVSSIAMILCLIPVCLEKPYVAILTLPLYGWLALGWSGLIVTAVAFAFFYAGVKRCSAYITASFSGLMPLTSLLLSFFWLQEPIIAVQWLGGICIIVGILLISMRRSTTSV